MKYINKKLLPFANASFFSALFISAGISKARRLLMATGHCLLLFILLKGSSACAQNQKPGWVFKTASAIIASPVSANGVIYVGSTDSNFYAIDAMEGMLRWKVKTNGDIRSTACIYQDKICFMSGDGYAWCIDTGGHIKWKFKSKGENKYELFSFADYFQSSPVYDSGIIYIGSADHFIYALQAQTGKLIWKFKTAGIVHATACIYKGAVYIGSFDGYFYALNKASGKLIWRFKSVGQQYFPKGEFNGSASAWGNTVFVGARDYNFYALDFAKPFCHWNKSFQKGWAITTPLIDDSLLYIGTSDDRLFLCLNPLNGNTKWSFNAMYNIFGGPAVADSIIYFGTMMGHVFGLNKTTGEKVFDFTTLGYRQNKETYFKEDDTYRDDIYSIIKKNEDFLLLYQKMGAVIAKPLVLGNTIIISSMDGNIYAVARY